MPQQTSLADHGISTPDPTTSTDTDTGEDRGGSDDEPNTTPNNNIDAPDAFHDVDFEIREWEESGGGPRCSWGTIERRAALPDANVEKYISDPSSETEAALLALRGADAVTTQPGKTSPTGGSDRRGIDLTDDADINLDADAGAEVTAARIFRALDADARSEVRERYETLRERVEANRRFDLEKEKRWREGSGEAETLKVTFTLRDHDEDEEYELIMVNHCDVGGRIEGRGNREYELPDEAREYARSKLPTEVFI